MNLNKRKKMRSQVISSDASGQRIDNFLFRYLKKIPKSRIYQMLRKGEVRVNRGRIKQTYRLNTGDIIRVPPVYIDEQIKPSPSKQLQQKIVNSILYEDNSLMIINKPSGIVVHGGSRQKYGIIETIRAYSKSYEKLGLVHRLDKETSGCLILAKDMSSLKKLNRAIQSEQITKTYLALLAGRMNKKEIVVDQSLNKSQLRSGERMVIADKTGKKAITRFYRKQLYENATLAHIELLTGRTHQIRVHGAYIKHPIIGDYKYGERVINNRFKAQGLKRLFLHAMSLELCSPDHNKIIFIEAPLAPELKKLLDMISVQ